MPDVNVEKPPPPEEEKAFWPLDDSEQRDDVDDIALLASRCRIGAKPASSGSQVTINNDFAGLAAILTPFFPAAVGGKNTPSTPTAVRSTQSVTASPAKPTKMSIFDFCTAFKLSDDIHECLLPLELDGPHVLEYLETSVLDSYLKLGQQAALRYAEAEWKKGKLGL
jgi:hypothetical protein